MIAISTKQRITWQNGDWQSTKDCRNPNRSGKYICGGSPMEPACHAGIIYRPNPRKIALNNIPRNERLEF